MSALPPPLPPSFLDEVLDEIAARGGWSRVRRGVESAGPSGFRVRPVAARFAERILLLEAPVAARVPPYRDRLRLRLEVAPASTDTVILADAAHANLVWTRLTPATGGRRLYEELRTPADRALLVERLISHPAPEPDPPAQGIRAGADRLVQVVDREWRRAERNRGGGRPSDPVDRIARLVDVGELRSVMRILSRVAVLDPECRDGGEWLEGAAEGLDALNRAAVYRARALVADARASHAGRRPEHLSDLARAVSAESAAAEASIGRSRLRGTIVQRHLHAIARSRVTADRVRARLLDWAGIPAPLAVGIDTSVRVDPAAADGCAFDATAGQPNGAAVRQARRSGDDDREIDALSGSWRLTADRRLSAGYDLREWRIAAARLERCRRRLDRTRRRTAVVTSSTDRLASLFPHLAGGRALLIVRGEGG